MKVVSVFALTLLLSTFIISAVASADSQHYLDVKYFSDKGPSGCSATNWSNNSGIGSVTLYENCMIKTAIYLSSGYINGNLHAWNNRWVDGNWPVGEVALYSPDMSKKIGLWAGGVTTWDTNDHYFENQVTPGWYWLTIRFLNDDYKPWLGVDRNMIVQEIIGTW